ncbi:Por secretion system C-terminal sorting domain-containing protein [Tenacibaculum sp. MAR_2010_89]|uniref:DUF4114 domain-containing protein n=1 Tax=Tenacibaculum sp. MAR_2010_89 TaxID=1250198 RepID=UPI00089446FC|nr:DUF4114 domain-containing protein [Tenacibaculum sp. MAR_2010_89]SEE11818.1 Por secretion system C-terminal sorting domain-containing protein [Tenacibaculum sp. MAR_2010_89]
MKKLLLFIVFIGQVTIAQNYNYLGTYSSNGKPDYLENPGDNVSVETLEMISNSLPESYPVPDYNPQYITAGYDTSIELNAQADVFVTFVSEGAGYRNVLGFYTYDINNPPTTKPSDEDITIIFPNVSALGSGGGLQTGDKVKIGSFPANTGIGWVLMANAWSSTYQTVGYGHWTLFSEPSFNPESSPSLQYHNVLLSDSDNERIILGFEDIRRDYSSCDQDFNDAIFYVTASPFSALKTTNVADVSSANNVTSSYDGGLESNGKLAQLIAKRNLDRSKNKTFKNIKEFQKPFNKLKLLKKGSKTLVDYLPTTGMYGNETSNVSSPTDLIGITNAKEVFSVDYYNGSERVSAVLATRTEGKVYDHSKAICDRLNNSEIEDVRTVITREHKIVSSKIKRANGVIEYTLSFSVKTGDGDNELHSYWNIDKYPEGDYMNFQVWGSTYSQVFSVANYILDSFIEDKTLTSNPEETTIPTVFVKSGSYSNGKITIDIINKSKSKEIVFDGNIYPTETSNSFNMNTAIELSGEWNETLTIETGVLFDIGFSLSVPGNDQIDALYLADGPWGLDYLKEYASVTRFEVTNNDVTDVEGIYEVNREIEVEGKVKGNMNIFRHLLAGDQTLDVAEYDYLSFTVNTNKDIEIVLMPEGLEDWSSRLRYKIKGNSKETKYEINFNDFVDQNGVKGDVKDVKTIVFSVIGDYINEVEYSVGIKDVVFRSGVALGVQDFADTASNDKLLNYPNPFKNTTMIRLNRESSFANIKVFDLLGRVVYSEKVQTSFSNRKQVVFNEPGFTSGIYKYMVIDDEENKYNGTFIVAK